MRSLTTTLVGVGVAAGFAVAAVGYQGSATSASTENTAAVALPTARPTLVEDRFRPCEAGWRLTSGGGCLRVVTTVVAGDSPASSGSAGSASGHRQSAAAPRASGTAKTSRGGTGAPANSAGDRQEQADHEDADHEQADHEDADHEQADHEDADHEDAEHEDELDD